MSRPRKPTSIDAGMRRLVSLLPNIFEFVCYAMARRGRCRADEPMSWRTQYLTLAADWLHNAHEVAKMTLEMSEADDQAKWSERGK